MKNRPVVGWTDSIIALCLSNKSSQKLAKSLSRSNILMVIKNERSEIRFY